MREKKNQRRETRRRGPHDVDVAKVDGVRRDRDDVLHLHDVLVAPEMPQQLDLPQDTPRVGARYAHTRARATGPSPPFSRRKDAARALCVDEIREHVRDFFYGHAPARRRIVRRAHDAVGPAADGPQVRVPDVDVKLVAAQRHAVVLSSERHFLFLSPPPPAGLRPRRRTTRAAGEEARREGKRVWVHARRLRSLSRP